MIINCDECGESVSDKAKSCPSCGNPINLSILDRLLKVLSYLFLLPIRFYQEAWGISYSRHTNDDKFVKGLFLKPIDLILVLYGVIRVLLTTLIFSALISDGLATDDSLVSNFFQIHLTKYQETLIFPLFWDIYLYTLLVTHVYFAVLLFFYFKKYKLL